ncbi:MAG TPA: hypothetical protein VGQ36_14015 [Thermoanaerobaculia bacterium]|jgi:hypothetical protein|nr:hypothetical protein [Thermoanaerobaculia bacterium]
MSTKATKTTKPRKGKASTTANVSAGALAKYPRHSILKALRIPRALLDQNAGKPATDREAADFIKVAFAGPFKVELSSALKYGFLERPEAGTVQLTDLGRRVLRPQLPSDALDGMRQAVMNAPQFSDVYLHYRGENLPEPQFFQNAIVDKFRIPPEKVPEFTSLFLETLAQAQLIEDHAGKQRLLDVAQDSGGAEKIDTLKKLGKEVKVTSGDTCFMIMPFASPIGGYYALVYDPAIRKAGLTPMRADNEIFATGKIIDQIWSGINAARVLVAELTTRNANVFYELGLAHALRKPVVLVSSNEADVPFDLHHIRVIYYDVNDPFWGEKLIAKIAENILSALKNPEEAIFNPRLEVQG